LNCYLYLDVCKPQMAHCDIKSSNILVKRNGDCCLSDFSLAVRCDPYVFVFFNSIKTKRKILFSHTKDIQGGGVERLYHRVGTKLYMPPELLDKNSVFNFDRINAYQQGDMYSLALVLWEIGNCCCSITHIRPYENQLSINFTIDDLIQLVCIEQKRPISCITSSDKVRKKRNENKSNEILFSIDSHIIFQFA
jgi:serine/threonine protein kinase